VWQQAVDNLGQALKLKPQLILAKANLGLAYLVNPARKDVHRADQYFKEASEQLTTLPANELPEGDRAAILINTGVAELAGNHGSESARLFDQAEKLLKETPAGRAQLRGAVGAALLYNRALLRTAAKDTAERKQGLVQLEQYLRKVSPASVWRPLAYDQYVRLCRELDLAAQPEAKLLAKAQSTWRLPVSITVKPPTAEPMTIFLSQPLSEVVRRLGTGMEEVLVPDSDLKRRRYPELGIDIIGTDIVLGIALTGKQAPVLALLNTERGGRAPELHLGMRVTELERILLDERAGCDEVHFTDPKRPEYMLYFDPALHHENYAPHALAPRPLFLGLAVRFDRSYKAEEFMIVQIPRS
jgi:hypothetical protein